MLKKTKTRDFSFNISGPGSNPSQSPSPKPSKKKGADGDEQPLRKGKNKSAAQPEKARHTDEPDDADFENDFRPRPPKAKKAKRHLAPKAEKAKAAPSPNKPGTELMVLEPQKPGRISRLNKKGLNSILGDDAEALQQMLEAGEADNALSQLNKRLIQTSIDLISEVEAGIRESKGRYGVHSFNGLVQSIRELMIDLQSTQDRGAVGMMLVEKVLRPGMLDIGMAIMKELALITDDAKTLGLPESNMKEFRERMVQSRTRLGTVMQEQHDKMKTEIIQAMQR
jgi:hypothetical protein